MPRFTVLIRSHVVIEFEAQNVDNLQTKVDKWRTKHRNQKFGRDALCVTMPGPPLVILDEHHERVDVQQKLKFHQA